jgi:hypothetical protein
MDAVPGTKQSAKNKKAANQVAAGNIKHLRKDFEISGERPLRLDTVIADRAAQIASTRAYLRAAQAYMLISMPTGTSTTFGAFQAIQILPSALAHRIGASLAPTPS